MYLFKWLLKINVKIEKERAANQTIFFQIFRNLSGGLPGGHDKSFLLPARGQGPADFDPHIDRKSQSHNNHQD